MRKTAKTYVQHLDSGRFLAIHNGRPASFTHGTSKEANQYLADVGAGKVNFESQTFAPLAATRPVPLATGFPEPELGKYGQIEEKQSRRKLYNQPCAMPFEEACRSFVHRFTMEHVPGWARKPLPNGKFYAPQYSNDREWYKNTKFYGYRINDRGEARRIGGRRYCNSTNQTWPLGKELNEVYTVSEKNLKRVAARLGKPVIDTVKIAKEMTAREKPPVEQYADKAKAKKPAKGKTKPKNVPAKRKK